MKRAILVCGPESSGNRVITRLFVAGGCVGAGEHEQPWDNRWPWRERAIVWLHSFPHGGRWPDVSAVAEKLRQRHYEVHVVVMTRDHHCLVESQVRWGHARSRQEAVDNIREAYLRIFEQIDWCEFTVVSYEALVARPFETMHWLGEAVGVPWGLESLPEPITDENAKYYAAEVPV